VHEGVGLGLAICTEVSKLLNAKIWVESEEGKGSTFFFELNNVIQESKKENISKISLKTPDFETKTILVVEDEITNYLLL
jgi:signal transduction histidine kinase